MGNIQDRVQSNILSGARLVSSRSNGGCKSRLESFYEPLSANGTAASWDNSRSGGRTDTVFLCTLQDPFGFCSNDRMPAMPELKQWRWLSGTLMA
jgi:hypothetical protein